MTGDTFTLEARTPDGEIVTLTGRSTYTFSDWGTVETIAPPTPNPVSSLTPAP